MVLYVLSALLINLFFSNPFLTLISPWKGFLFLMAVAEHRREADLKKSKNTDYKESYQGKTTF